MGDQQSFNIEQVALAMGDRFHDDEILGRRQRYRRPGDLHDIGSCNGLFLKRQASEGDIDVDTRWLMPNQEHPRLVGKREGVQHSRDEAEPSSSI